ncbi:hypothetical protein A2U01_0119076, partial [Trifolium medium]|nr:hypothetical protein [Trifolium medium]
LDSDGIALHSQKIPERDHCPERVKKLDDFAFNFRQSIRIGAF